MKSAIKELRPSPNVRLITAEDLIAESPDGTTVFPAVRIERKGGRAEVSIVVEKFEGGDLPFRDAVLDRHGTIEAAAHVLRRHFRWAQMRTRILGFEMPVWELKIKRCEDFDLWVIVQWEGWNVAGVRWDDRNYRAQTECGAMSLGKMELKTFVRRCTRLGLKYLV